MISFFTSLEINGQEEDVTVNYEVDPDEPSTGYKGNLYVYDVIFNGKDIYPTLTPTQKHSLEIKARDHLRKISNQQGDDFYDYN